MKEKQAIILRHYRDGQSQRDIHRATGTSRKTIRKYLAAYERQRRELEASSGEPVETLIEDLVSPPRYDSSGRTKRKVTPALVARVGELLDANRLKRERGQHKQQMKKSDMHETLVAEGFDIGYTSVCNLVRELEHSRRESYIKQAYEPGLIVEFDWGEAKLTIGGQLRRVQMAVFTSACGNYRYSQLFFRQDTASFQQAHAQFFDHIGGVYRQVVYDNMRTAVKRFVGLGEKEATEGLLQLSLYYGFDFRFCNARRGNEKGHVERSVEYVRRKAFSGRDEFETLEVANAHLLATCGRLNDKPQVGSDGRSARHMLAIETECLLSVPPHPFECGQVREARVDKYATISVDTCHYSVPERLVGQVIRVKIYPNRIIAYQEDQVVAKHAKRPGQHEWSLQLDHYLTTLKRKPGALSGSVALQQAEPRLQAIYQAHFTESPRDFVDLLHYLRDHQKGIGDVEAAIKRLQILSTMAITTAKIKTILDRPVAVVANNPSTSSDHVMAQHLAGLAQLMPDYVSLSRQGAIV